MATSARKTASAPSGHCVGVSQRHLEYKVLHSEHSHLCRVLPTSSIIDELFSAGVIDSYQMEKVDAADTTQDKNRRLLRYLEQRNYPIKDLSNVLDKLQPFKHLAKELRAAVDKKRREYEKREREKRERGRHSVSPQQVEVHKKRLTEEELRFGIMVGNLGDVLDRYPEALERMKTALTFVTVPGGDESVLSIVQSRSFTEAPTASALLRSLAPITSVMDDTLLHTLTLASAIPEAVELFKEYLKAKDSTQELVLYVERSAKFLSSSPPSSEAVSNGFQEMIVRTRWEGVSVGEVQEMGRDVSGVLNVPPEGIISQGVRESSVSVIFWISERLIPFIQSEFISLKHLRFLYEEGISAIMIEDIYLLTTPPAECLDFWEACVDGDADMVQASLSAGVDVNVTTPPQNEANTGLIYAAVNGNNEVVHLLLASGADPNIQDTDGVTALMLAAQEGCPEVADVLLREGAHINIQNKDGFTALMVAAELGHLEVAELLLKEGAHINIQNKEGGTALMKAAEKGHVEVAEALLREGADVTVQAEGGTSPLMLAASSGHLEMIDLLLSVGAEVNRAGSSGLTPLMWAAYGGHVAVVNTLIERGADMRMLTENGASVLDLAKEANKPQVCEVLEKHGAKQTGPGSQERAKKGIAKLFDWVKKILNPSFISRIDIGGVKKRKQKKAMHISH